ncbi:NK-tumor recognition protein isoform 6-T12 [Trichechus inunguis]
MVGKGAGQKRTAQVQKRKLEAPQDCSDTPIRPPPPLNPAFRDCPLAVFVLTLAVFGVAPGDWGQGGGGGPLVALGFGRGGSGFLSSGGATQAGGRPARAAASVAMGAQDRPQCHFDIEINREPVG